MKTHYKIKDLRWCSNMGQKHSPDIKKVSCKMCLKKYHINSPVIIGIRQHEPGVIYKITNPKGSIYIGQTVNFNARLQYYRNLNSKNQKKLHNSFLKYGWHNHTFEIIEQCEIKDLNSKERYWQEFYNCTCYKTGLNCFLTETNTLRRVMSDEVKAKLSAHRKGKPLPRSTVEKIILSNKINKSRPDYVQKPISKIGRERMSQASLKNKSRHANLHLGRNKGYPILQISLEGEIIKEWDTSQQASKILKIDRGSISRVMAGKYKQAGGYIWKPKNPEHTGNKKTNFPNKYN